MGQTILVTGGAGYIGSQTCKALAAAGYMPVVYDNMEYGHEWAVKWGPLERGDLNDRTHLDAVMAEYRPSGVLHFAAYAYVGESVRHPAKYYRNNVVGTLSLLESMCAFGIDCLVFSSTCAIYGVPDCLPITESHPKNPVNPYGATKLAVERMLHDFRGGDGLRSYALRYFNAAGADPEGEIGEVHEPETHLIPLVLDAAAGISGPIRVFGNDYDTPDGTCIRDYIHVTDLAEAHVLALGKLLGGEPGGALNLGTGEGHSVLEVIDTARTVTGRDIKVEMVSRRLGDPAQLVAGAECASKEIGWKPTRSSLRVQIEDAWRWHQKINDATFCGG